MKGREAGGWTVLLSNFCRFAASVACAIGGATAGLFRDVSSRSSVLAWLKRWRCCDIF